MPLLLQGWCASHIDIKGKRKAEGFQLGQHIFISPPFKPDGGQLKGRIPGQILCLIIISIHWRCLSVSGARGEKSGKDMFPCASINDPRALLV
ncbi:MAG: hypothetical protein ACLPND_01695, partial [Candidatus Korobacteraceae bacterium]